jgi:DNA-binding NarL/FixJ family response regulator
MGKQRGDAQIPAPSDASSLVRVMLADDQWIVAEALARLIGAEPGLTVTMVTSDAAQLLVAAERDPPTVALIDAAMAQSFRTARALATRCPRTKVIMLDEFRLDVHLHRAIDCGVAGYLTKCDAPADLTAAIAKVVAGGLSLPLLMPTNFRLMDRPQPAANVEKDATSLALLTPRELEVLARLAEGLKVADCARELKISPNTVENHKAHIMRKLGLHKNVDLARFAIRHGLVSDA